MFGATRILKTLFNRCQDALAVCAFVSMLLPVAAFADALSAYSSFSLQQAMATNDRFTLYAPQDTAGFNIRSASFSSAASAPNNVEGFNDNQKLYALLIDGRYDFNYETPRLASPLRPYISGGMGMATAARANLAAESQGGSTVPLFRLGGGVAYRLGEQWDLSLDYKEGLAAPNAGDQVFTGRSQQSVDLHALNLGMSYLF